MRLSLIALLCIHLQVLVVPFQVTTAFSTSTCITNLSINNVRGSGSGSDSGRVSGHWDTLALLPQQVHVRTLNRSNNLRLRDLASTGIDIDIDIGIGNDIDRSDKEETDDNDNSNNSNIRPIHQNWWPVSTVEALATDRPNAVQLLGMDLVLFQNDSGSSDSNSDSDNDTDSGEWTCLQDRCSHRFAPLSEGRVVSTSSNDCSSKKHLECAYHGWRFDTNGSCNNIPQLEPTKQESTKVLSYCGVQSYPVRIDSGLVFVWADPETSNLGQLIPLPTFPALRNALDNQGPSACYMRDLPYGYELLGENLLDLAHLPFSHHSVGSLNRELGGPLPFKMLSKNQKSSDNPLYEAVLDDASSTDPILSGNPKTPVDATLNLGFYEPCHVRYTRRAASDSYVALYLCPTSASRSRVFLFNVFGAPSSTSTTTTTTTTTNGDNTNNTNKAPSSSSKLQRLKNSIKPASIKAKIQKQIFGLIFTPVFAHQIAHKIFDGDGIFLRMQGDRMQDQNLSYRDYKTPAAADILVNSFRRYTKTATELSKKAGKGDMAEAACSSKGYGVKLRREDMLDRYESHTKNCKVCSEALKSKEDMKGRIQVAKGIVRGGIGASASTLFAMMVLARSSSSPEVVVPSTVVRTVGKIFLGTVVASFGLSKLDEKNDKGIQQFLFEDYVHADKN